MVLLSMALNVKGGLWYHMDHHSIPPFAPRYDETQVRRPNQIPLYIPIYVEELVDGFHMKIHLQLATTLLLFHKDPSDLCG
jgi:hypothetical protein